MNFQFLDETSAPKESLLALATTKENFGMIPKVEKFMALCPHLLSRYAHMWELLEATTSTTIELIRHYANLSAGTPLYSGAEKLRWDKPVIRERRNTRVA